MSKIALDIYKFKIHITAITSIEFYNFPGIALRGGLGHVLKKSICIFKKIDAICKDCILINSCVYANAYESLNYSNKEVMKKASHLPHPFVLTPLVKDNIIKPGESFEIYLTLIGRGISYFPYFIYSLNELGKNGINKSRGQFSIKKITNLADNSDVNYDSLQCFENGLQPIKFFDNYELINSVRIEFLTPCRIVISKRETDSVSFELLFKTILRRIRLLSSLYWENSIDESCNHLLIQSKDIVTKKYRLKWEINERFSKRQNNKMMLKGFTGSVIYEGNLKQFYPFLKIAELINIGKNTSFGYGALNVMVE